MSGALSSKKKERNKPWPCPDAQSKTWPADHTCNHVSENDTNNQKHCRKFSSLISLSKNSSSLVPPTWTNVVMKWRYRGNRKFRGREVPMVISLHCGQVLRLEGRRIELFFHFFAEAKRKKGERRVFGDFPDHFFPVFVCWRILSLRHQTTVLMKIAANSISTWFHRRSFVPATVSGLLKWKKEANEIIFVILTFGVLLGVAGKNKLSRKKRLHHSRYQRPGRCCQTGKIRYELFHFCS